MADYQPIACLGNAAQMSDGEPAEQSGGQEK